jgi:hypothetical protein
MSTLVEDQKLPLTRPAFVGPNVPVTLRAWERFAGARSGIIF